MPATERRWTVEDVRRLREEHETREAGPWLRYEVVDGELVVTPAPSLPHQEAVAILLRILGDYLRARGAGHAYISPADVAFDTHTSVQPDVFGVPLVLGRRPRRWEDIERLLVVAEVLSPSSARHDRGKKRRKYQRQGVPEYWIVDLDARIVERWRPEDERPEVLADELRWHPEGAAEPLVIDLPAFFAEVHDEP